MQRDDPHATATTPSFQPKVETDTRVGQLNVGADLSIHLTVTNYSDAPAHLKMLVDPGYAGDVLSAKGAVADGKMTIAVTGLKLGEALLKPVLVSEDTRAPFKVHGPRTKLRVTSRQELAAEALVAGHQERMFGGGNWDKNDSEKATRTADLKSKTRTTRPWTTPKPAGRGTRSASSRSLGPCARTFER